MGEFTKEQLREHLDMRLTHTRKAVQENTGTGWAEFYEKEVSVLEIALAALTSGMEQEPVAYIDPFTFKNFSTFRAGETDNKRMGREWVWANPDAGLIPLYAAPQLPQPVPVGEDDNFYSWFGREWHENYQNNQYTSAAKQMLGVMAESAWRAGRSAAMLQGAEPERGWIPCSERMPIDNDIVLVVDDGYFVCEAQYRKGEFFSAVRGNGEFFETTCRDVELWIPLPAAPQQECKHEFVYGWHSYGRQSGYQCRFCGKLQEVK